MPVMKPKESSLAPENDSVFDPLYLTMLKKAMDWTVGRRPEEQVLGAAMPMTTITGQAVKRAPMRAVKALREFLDSAVGEGVGKFSNLTAGDVRTPVEAATSKILGPTERLTSRFVDSAPIPPSHFAEQGAQFIVPSFKRNPEIEKVYQAHLARQEAAKAKPAWVPPAPLKEHARDTLAARTMRSNSSLGEVEEMREIATGAMKDKPLNEVVDWLVANRGYNRKKHEIAQILRGEIFPTRDLSKIRNEDYVAVRGPRVPQRTTFGNEMVKRELKAREVPAQPTGTRRNNRDYPSEGTLSGRSENQMRDMMKERLSKRTLPDSPKE